jgi:hypothetical protein
MPIIDVQFVLPKSESLPEGLAQTLVDRLGHVLAVKPGSLWLRLQVGSMPFRVERDSLIWLPQRR